MGKISLQELIKDSREVKLEEIVKKRNEEKCPAL
jgi:hypothetical protein